MKKVKIGFTALALMAGLVSVFVTRASKFSGTVYWIDYKGTRFNQVAPPAECPNTGSVLCATAYNISGHPTGTIAVKP